MLEFRHDAPISAIVFWGIALVVWIIIKIRSKKD